MSELMILNGRDKKVKVKLATKEYLPFGVIQREVRSRQNPNKLLTVNGMYLMDVSNKYGMIVCAYQSKVKVYYGTNLKEENELMFPDQVKCLKICGFDEKYIAIGFKGNILRVYSLRQLIQGKNECVKSPFYEIPVQHAISQVKWNLNTNDRIIIREMETGKTSLIELPSEEVKSMMDTDCIVFDSRDNIVAIRDNQLVVFVQGDLENPYNQDASQFVPVKHQKIFLFQEYDKDKWIVAGFVQGSEDEFSFMLTPCTGNILGVFQYHESLQHTAKEVYGNMEDYIKYQVYIDFKLVLINQNTLALFNSVDDLQMLLSIDSKGTFFQPFEGDKQKFDKFKGFIQGACLLNFKCDEDNSKVTYQENPDKIILQSVPISVLTYDCEYAILRHFVCENLSLEEKNTIPKDKQPKLPQPLPQEEERQKKKQIVNENQEIKVLSSISQPLFNQEIKALSSISQPLFNQEIKVLSSISQPLFNQQENSQIQKNEIICKDIAINKIITSSIVNNERDSQQIVNNQSIEKDQRIIQDTMNNERKSQDIMNNQKINMGIFKQEIISHNTVNNERKSQDIMNNQRINMGIFKQEIIRHDTLEDERINQFYQDIGKNERIRVEPAIENLNQNIQQVEEPMELEENIVLPQDLGGQICYDVASIKKYLENIAIYEQSITSKPPYSKMNSIFNCFSESKHYSQRVKHAQYDESKFNLHQIFPQPSMNSVEYIFEIGTLFFCTNEKDEAYLYALTLDQYAQIANTIQELTDQYNQGLNTIKKPIDKQNYTKQKRQQIEAEIKGLLEKRRVWTSKDRIISIHNLFSRFLGIVLENKLIIQPISGFQDNDRQETGFQFPFKAKRVIFSHSKLRCIIFSSETDEICVMDTFTSEIIFKEQHVKFANFSYNDKDILYLVTDKLIKQMNIQSKENLTEFPSGCELEGDEFIHFEEFTPGIFLTAIIGKSAKDNTECRVSITSDLNEPKKEINRERCMWDCLNQFKISSVEMRVIFNPQNQCLIAVLNQKGSFLVQHVEFDSSSDQRTLIVSDPSIETPSWKSGDQPISGVLFFPYSIPPEEMFFDFPLEKGSKLCITPRLPSILVFNGLFQLHRFVTYDHGNATMLEPEDRKLEKLQVKYLQQSPLITLEEYKQIIYAKTGQFLRRPDYFFLHEQKEQLKFILEILKTLNLSSLDEYSLVKFMKRENQGESSLMPPIENESVILSETQETNHVGNLMKCLAKTPNLDNLVSDTILLKKLPKTEDFTSKCIHTNDKLRKEVDYLRKEITSSKDKKAIFLRKTISSFPNEKQNANLNQKQAQSLNLSAFSAPENITIFANQNSLLTYEGKVITINGNQTLTEEPLSYINYISVLDVNTHLLQQEQLRKKVNSLQQLEESKLDLLAKSKLDAPGKPPLSDIKDDNKVNQKGSLGQRALKQQEIIEKNIHLLVGCELPSSKENLNTLYVLKITVKSDEITGDIVSVIHRYTSSLLNVSVYNSEISEILITTENGQVILLYMEAFNTKVIYSWKECSYGMFTFEGKILITTKDRKIHEHQFIQKKIMDEKKATKTLSFKDIGIDASIMSIAYMHQLNSKSIFAVGISKLEQNKVKFHSYSLLTDNLQVVKQSQNVSMTEIICRADAQIKSQTLQFRCVYSPIFNHIFLFNNMNNILSIYPMSINQIAHATLNSTFQLDPFTRINGLSLFKANSDSTELFIYELSSGIKQIQSFTKNTQSIYYKLF